MIPISDKLSRRRIGIPFMTYGLIALNLLVYFLQLGQGVQLNAFINQWGAVPARLENWTADPFVLVTLVTSAFLHGGWMHLLGNMLYLGVFGDNVEDELGHGRFLLFYLAGGVGAGLAQVFVTPGSPIPAIGASGAVAAVLGAYVALHPRAPVNVLFFFFIFIRVITMPAFLVLGLWFVTQLFNGAFALTSMNAAYAGGVAWWAHIGGFVIGMVVGWLARGQQPPPEPLIIVRRPYEYNDTDYRR